MEDAAFQAYLSQLPPHDRAEAIAAAAAAKRAEERAEERAMARAIQDKHQQRQRLDAATAVTFMPNGRSGQLNSNPNRGVVFIPKQKRQQMEASVNVETTKGSTSDSISSMPSRKSHPATKETSDAVASLSEKERLAVMETYLGKSATDQEDEHLQKRKKVKINKKTTFKFRWDEADDTSNFEDADDPLYAPLAASHASTERISAPASAPRATGHLGSHKWHAQIMSSKATASSLDMVMHKSYGEMMARDWRIVRENFEITVKGGRAPPPLRSWSEPSTSSTGMTLTLHSALLESIRTVLGFKDPSPIQRQAIPIGMQRRDLIGISETGSGKTVAFGVPMCHYILSLPADILASVADQGALALVMAPTRELALQIDTQLQKLLSCQDTVISGAIVGGQPIQQQAQMIRKGVHIIVGTPGRINECIEMAYLVLNQCCYIVMDEADRMIDMGFAPQMESILEAMGGTMKSEDETETYRQEMEDLEQSGVARHRLTAMFSATMPMEVERIAKQYLRHPAIISIGDVDSGKNSRIEQKLVWLPTPAKKEEALRELLRDRRFVRDKVIVFVNEKKHADSVGRMVERSGRQCVVLHGGKSQEQREENLEAFRKGGIVMVATDVAGRGLDIPDVAHVINYDLPTRSIENYTHRIGRTGRAGKEGLATSFITDEDEGIIPQLIAYLKSTGNQIPDRLARHAAAKSGAPSDGVMY